VCVRSPMSLTPRRNEIRAAGQILYSFPLEFDPAFNQQIYNFILFTLAWAVGLGIY
jgi:hypothetical protein